MRLATLMDGTIHVESTPGHGSVFSLLLNVFVPDEASGTWTNRAHATNHIGSRLREGLEIRVPKTNRSDATLPETSKPLKEARVLVVEDMAVNQVIITTLLREAGAKVEIADNGAMGVQKVMQDMDNGLVFDVILMDMQMPVMDGYEATTYLRKHGYTRPIIAVTAHALTGDREKTLKAGCDDYLAKPSDNQSLISMVKKHVGVD
jgi:CheY-like chemotaxis protein